MSILRHLAVSGHVFTSKECIGALTPIPTPRFAPREVQNFLHTKFGLGDQDDALLVVTIPRQATGRFLFGLVQTAFAKCYDSSPRMAASAKFFNTELWLHLPPTAKGEWDLLASLIDPLLSNSPSESMSELFIDNTTGWLYGAAFKNALGDKGDKASQYRLWYRASSQLVAPDYSYNADQEGDPFDVLDVQLPPTNPTTRNAPPWLSDLAVMGYERLPHHATPFSASDGATSRYREPAYSCDSGGTSTLTADTNPTTQIAPPWLSDLAVMGYGRLPYHATPFSASDGATSRYREPAYSCDSGGTSTLTADTNPTTQIAPPWLSDLAVMGYGRLPYHATPSSASDGATSRYREPAYSCDSGGTSTLTADTNPTTQIAPPWLSDLAVMG
ncbi:hypothetical protein FRC17_004415, partial [Serendipita sp. 399]